MSINLPPWPGFVFPPPPPHPPPPPWRPPPSSTPTPNSSSQQAGAVLWQVSASPLGSCCYSSPAYATSSEGIAIAAPMRPPMLPRRLQLSPYDLSQRCQISRTTARSSSAAPAPHPHRSFDYNRSVRHNVTSGGSEEAATCSVCLGAFQVGETVRLLPVCLHLYRVECIDPWLDAHSTCPLCRSHL